MADDYKVVEKYNTTDLESEVKKLMSLGCNQLEELA